MATVTVERWALSVEEAKQVMAKNNWILAQAEPIEIGLPSAEKRACEAALAYNLPWAKMATVIDKQAGVAFIGHSRATLKKSFKEFWSKKFF